MEEMNTKVVENEELEDIAKVEEAEENNSVGALVAGVAGDFLVYAMVGGVKRPWGFVGTELAEYKATEKARTEVVDTGYAEVTAEDSDERDSEK